MGKVSSLFDVTRNIRSADGYGAPLAWTNENGYYEPVLDVRAFLGNNISVVQR